MGGYHQIGREPVAAPNPLQSSKTVNTIKQKQSQFSDFSLGALGKLKGYTDADPLAGLGPLKAQANAASQAQARTATANLAQRFGGSDSPELALLSSQLSGGVGSATAANIGNIERQAMQDHLALQQNVASLGMQGSSMLSQQALGEQGLESNIMLQLMGLKQDYSLGVLNAAGQNPNLFKSNRGQDLQFQPNFETGGLGMSLTNPPGYGIAGYRGNHFGI